jgi:adenylate cyclase
MGSEERNDKDVITKVWREYLNTGDMPDYIPVPWYLTKRFQDLYRQLPDNPRCRLCHIPFEGVGGTILRHALKFAPSRLNPHICNYCDEFIQNYKGGAEVELSILFADVRGSTQLAEKMSPTEYSQIINRFYNVTTKVLFDSGALVEKLIGDAATGFYTHGIAGHNHAQIAVRSAREILRVTGHHPSAEPWVPVGIGVHTGMAYVGAVHTDTGASDITVLGDTANIGARLASMADPGEIVISQATAHAAGLEPAGIEIRRPILKGRTEPIEVWVLTS